MHNLRRIIWNTVFKGRSKFFVQSLKNNAKCLCTMECPPAEKTETAPFDFTIPKGIFGQPTCHSHPHLIPEGHLTCGITQTEYRQRRDMLVNILVSEVDNQHLSHVIVIPGAPKKYMSDKIPYVFRQNSDFYYLTGCLEPSAILVIVKPPQTNIYKSTLFVQEKDSHAELWEGPRTGCEGAIRLFAVDETMPVDYFNTFVTKTTSAKSTVLWYQNESPVNPEIHRTIQSVTKNDHISVGDPQRAIHLMRVIKSPAEIELMKETCYIGSQAMNMAMACTKPGISEHSVNAILDFTCRQAGAEHLAFPPVVAGGPRATHIHYVSNNQILDAKEMLLVDSGSQRWLYNSDISRTWPVSGQFSQYHRILYELVLTVQKRLIELLGQQRPPLDQLFDQMCRLLGVHLQQEGILPKNIDGNELIAKAYRLCPHHVSHYLGLDVHDSPLVRRNVSVQSNMVVTVEPGIYIRPDDKTIPEEFRGIGIRIEDDVLITDSDPLVLTETCVKEVNDIESIVGKQQI